jgi:small-conductance mechanosensitive channel
MRPALFMFLLLLGFGITAPATVQAQTAASLLGGHHPPATPAAAAAAPAPAIIPGSPLAALAGAGAAAQPAKPATTDADTPAPFGTDELGFVISGAVGGEAVHALNGFLDAVRDSTRLTPVTSWLAATRDKRARGVEADAVLMALVIVIFPAALADAIIRLGLRRPAALFARWALPKQEEFLPDAEAADAEAADTQPVAPAGPAGPAGPVHTQRYVSLRAWGRRLLFALLKLLLAMLPLAGFIVTAQVILSSGFITHRAAQLTVTGIANAYLACRAVQELARFLISPAAPSLRLIAMPSARAQSLMGFLLIVLSTLLFASGIISGAVILGLPHEGAKVLIRLTALAVHLEMAIGIWRCRRVVGIWLMGDPKATGATAWLRQRLGRWWYLFALFYVLALWVAWAGGVHNAFSLLLRAVVVLIAAVVAGRLAWTGSSVLLDRMFPDPATAKTRQAMLLSRAHAYNPFIRVLIRAAIAAGVLLFILQGWGVDALGWLHSNTISRALISALTSVLVTTSIALVLWETVNFVLHSRVDRLTSTGRKRQASRLRTLVPILRGAIGTVIFLVALVVCLSQIGVNTTGLLAVSSIAGIAVGFGSQKLVQDIITGLFMLLEDAIQVGDNVTLAGMSGTVEKLSIRTIHLRGGDGSLNIIPFSSVTTVTNTTRDFNNAQFAITVSYGENIDHVFAVLTDIGRDMRAEPGWGSMMRDDLQIYGLDKFGEQGMVISGVIRTGPGQLDAVRRELFRRVQTRFAEDGISMPFGKQSVFRLEGPEAERLQHEMAPPALEQPPVAPETAKTPKPKTPKADAGPKLPL